MGKIVFMFPGQGAQYVGMGKDFYDSFACSKETFDKANEVLDIDVKKLCFEENEDINITEYTQAAMVTASVAILKKIEEMGLNPDLTAGLSLGEYTALIEDGVISFDDGVKLVEKRGKIMQNLTPNGNWKMAAIMGLDEEQVEDICKKVKSGFVVPANYNTIGQIVISGEEKAILKAEELAKEAGAKKVSILKTSGPFHTSKLEKCSEALKEELQQININKQNSKVVKNIDGEMYKATDNIVDILSKHIMNPVRFTKCLQTMYNNGINTFIEIGPGKTLSSFVKRMKFEGPVKIMNISNCNELEKVIEELTELSNLN